MRGMRGFEQIDLMIDRQIIWFFCDSVFFDGAFRHGCWVRTPPACLSSINLSSHLMASQHAGGARTQATQASSCAAPSPVFGLFRQTRLDRIVFDVPQRILKVSLVPNVTIERLTSPEPASAPQDFVAIVGGEAFPGVQDLTHFELG